MATRRGSAIKPAAPVLTVEQLRRRIERLQKCIDDLEAFDPEIVQKRDGVPQVIAIERAIDGALEAAFGHLTPAYNRFRAAARLDHGPQTMRISPDWGGGSFGNYDPREAHEARLHLAEGKARSIVLLREAIRAVEDEIADREPECHPALVAATQSPAHNRKVFVVHGREEGPREAVARFLERLGFEPIILHEQANQGRTVIEKVEDHSDVGFAVIILTPDDMGNLKGEAPQPRARQNVLLELGYFIGKLTRKRVCTLKVGDLEIPSDWRGVVDEPYDAGAGWRQTLARELEAAGYEIDWNKVMRR
jgi:predicted nucleotide-binding protein